MKLLLIPLLLLTTGFTMCEKVKKDDSTMQNINLDCVYRSPEGAVHECSIHADKDVTDKGESTKVEP
jgi:hypothetical protein